MAQILVNIDVDDLERAVKFYTRAFELGIGRRFGADAVELFGAGVALYLLRKPAGSAPFAGASSARAYERHWTPVHLDFVVTDLEQAVARARAAGARPESEISQHDWGRMALFHDPFGHGFCLLQLSEQGYDAITTA